MKKLEGFHQIWKNYALAITEEQKNKEYARIPI
jgi:hypothetical protein